MATRARRPTLWPSEETCVHPRREDKEDLGEKHGKASRGVDGGKRQATASASSRHTTSQCIVRDMICNSGECEGFESRVSPSSPSSSSPWVFPPSRSLVPGWGNCVFLLNTIFPRDRGGQRHDQKAFILPAFLLMLGYLYRNGPLYLQTLLKYLLCFQLLIFLHKFLFF